MSGRCLPAREGDAPSVQPSWRRSRVRADGSTLCCLASAVFSSAAAAPLSPTSAWRIVQEYATVCGLSHIKPHDFRRFLGTQIVATTGDIRKAQKALGHKSIEGTARHYVLDELEAGLSDGLY
jgi:site-specific recombinase XerD